MIRARSRIELAPRRTLKDHTAINDRIYLSTSPSVNGMIVSPLQNFSAGAQFVTGYGGAVPAAMYSHHHHNGQLQSVYNAVAAQQHDVYNNAAGQQPPMPYRPAAEYDGAKRPQSPYMTPSRYYEPHRPSTTAAPPSRKHPVRPQQPSPPSVQYTRVEAGVPGGTA